MAASEGCPLCPPAGFPHPPSSSSSTPDTEPEELWIACSKCAEWYHTACVALSPEFKSTVPDLALAEIDKASQGAWIDWADWIDRWYCNSCTSKSLDPENPHRPHHPLVSTLKASYHTRKRSAPSSEKPGSPKRARASASAQPAEEKSSRPKRKAAENAPDYYAWNHGIAAPTTKWLKLISEPEKYGAHIVDGDFPCVPGKLLLKEWLDSSPGDPAWNDEFPPSLFVGPERRPLLVKKQNGGIESMGGHLPNKDLKITDIANLVSPDRMVDVIDVATQTSAQWTLQKWADYFTTASDPEYNGKVYNVISLEVTGTPLGRRVKPPRIVREIDWVENCWHFGPGGKTALSEEPVANGANGVKDVNGANGVNGHTEEPKTRAPSTWPKVQLYCLMGIRGSWTDWHVDFAASSVYYSIHTGAKEFYFIRPTEANLKAYAEWSGSAELQQNTWLGSMCEGPVERVRIEAGETMMIPAGYIHAVYTPRNAIVFGGNFVHSYNISTQLRLRQIEIDTKVPQRFRFPQFDRLCWYVAEKACGQLRQLRAYRQKASTASPPPQIILEGLLELAKFLQSQIDTLEDHSAEEKRRKLIYDRIPGEMVKDGHGLAKELTWRVQRELPVEEVKEESLSKASGRAVKQKPKKIGERLGTPVSRVVNAQSDWKIADLPAESLSSTVELLRPGSDTTSVATVTRDVRKQKRSRQLYLDDGGVMQEEQELIVIETRTAWDRPEENGTAAIKQE